jgi:hypothetical protein
MAFFHGELLLGFPQKLVPMVHVSGENQFSQKKNQKSALGTILRALWYAPLIPY